MALSTRNKRASAILVGLPFGRVYPHPDASITSLADRQQMCLSYAGVEAQDSAPTITGMWANVATVLAANGRIAFKMLNRRIESVSANRRLG